MTAAVATRPCATPGCERGALPHWTMCADCIDDIFDPTPARQVFVRRLSDDPALLIDPAPRRAADSDLATDGVGMPGASRDVSRPAAEASEEHARSGRPSTRPDPSPASPRGARVPLSP